jgi:hypothetical protein
MEKRLYFIIPVLAFFATPAFNQNIGVMERTYVSSVPEAQVIMGMPTDSSLKLDPTQFSINNGTGESVFCTRIVIGKNRVKFFFLIKPSNFYAFEKLVTDSVGYFLDNKENIRLSDTTIQPGELHTITQNAIRKIPEDSWKKFVSNQYSAGYLFPPTFGVGMDPGAIGADSARSAQTVYYVHLIQSGNWTDNAPLFWGIQGRWSTGHNDKANFVKFYPLTVLFNTGVCKLSLGSGIETGYLGFEKQGQGILKADARFRLPFNLIDLTLGSPRVRIFPMISMSAQGNLGWADVPFSDSLKRDYDITAGIRYDIPISKTYLLQVGGKANYASSTQKVQYQYDMSLGYIANGTLRIAAAYEQGYQEVSYQFDRKLLLEFAFDVLNTETGK